MKYDPMQNEVSNFVFSVLVMHKIGGKHGAFRVVIFIVRERFTMISCKNRNFSHTRMNIESTIFFFYNNAFLLDISIR